MLFFPALSFKSNGNIPVLLSYPWQSSSVLVPRKKPRQLPLSQLSLKHSQKLSSGQHQILSRNTSTQTQQQPFSFPHCHPHTSPRREVELHFKFLLFKVLYSSVSRNFVFPTAESPGHSGDLKRSCPTLTSLRPAAAVLLWGSSNDCSSTSSLQYVLKI